MHMSNYNDFDLDIRHDPIDSYKGVTAAILSEQLIDCATTATVYGTICGLTLQCTNDCSKTCTQNNCTAESCSDCHSYCGAACR